MLTHNFRAGLNRCAKHPLVILSHEVEIEHVTETGEVHFNTLPETYCEICRKMFERKVLVEKIKKPLCFNDLDMEYFTKNCLIIRCANVPKRYFEI